MTGYMPNEFMQAELSRIDGHDRVIMKITGMLVDILIKMDPGTCKNKVTCENGQQAMHVDALQAIHGMFIASSFFLICLDEIQRALDLSLIHMTHVQQTQWQRANNKQLDSMWIIS